MLVGEEISLLGGGGSHVPCHENRPWYSMLVGEEISLLADQASAHHPVKLLPIKHKHTLISHQSHFSRIPNPTSDSFHVTAQHAQR